MQGKEENAERTLVGIHLLPGDAPTADGQLVPTTARSR